MNPTKKRRLLSANTTGYNGVTKTPSKRYQAKIYIDHKTKPLGTYDTPKEAALAFDRAVIKYKRPSSLLNYPNDYTTSSDDESSDEESDNEYNNNNGDISELDEEEEELYWSTIIQQKSSR